MVSGASAEKLAGWGLCLEGLFIHPSGLAETSARALSQNAPARGLSVWPVLPRSMATGLQGSGPETQHGGSCVSYMAASCVIATPLHSLG